MQIKGQTMSSDVSTCGKWEKSASEQHFLTFCLYSVTDSAQREGVTTGLSVLPLCKP